MNIFLPYYDNLDRNLVLKLLFAFCSIFFIMNTSDVFAAASADPVGDVLCKMILTFRGNTARGIAVIGIVVLGIQTLRGQLKWEVALVIITGVIILFKAPEIISMVAGIANASCCVS